MLIVACHQGMAASPDAWTEHYDEVKRKCIQASSLEQKKPAGEVIDFSDEIGYSMLIVKGVHKFDKKLVGMEVCLFNRGDRSATITEADRLINSQ